MSRSPHTSHRLSVSLTLLVALSLLPEVGCVLRTGGRPASGTFALEAQGFDREVLERAQAWVQTEPDKALCDALCELQAPGDKKGVDTCSHVLHEQTDKGRVVGELSCTGWWGTLATGRRPQGWRAPRIEQVDALGALLSRMAHEEHAAAQAFTQLAGQLRRWGAPEACVARCESAAQDERAHARIVVDMLAERGLDVVLVDQAPVYTGLLEAARNNVIEGCANETASALFAQVLAIRAPSVALRTGFARIARDEMRHAELSWDLHRWFVGQVGELEAAALEGLLRAAVADIPEIFARECARLPDGFGYVDGLGLGGVLSSALLAA
ncbi:MAG: hypothetical protein KC912_23725 [Proteobacteria bacterium]|nr:hypothetical protein [Pseudomonadota bacterium]